MKPPPLYACRGFRFTLAILLFPPLFWCLMLLVVPTECARRTLVERLSAATGRDVKLGKLRIGFCGGLELENLTFAAPSSSDPWLEVGDAAINVSLAQLLFGTVEPTDVTLNNPDLRILRRADGTLELADFVPQTLPTASSTASPPETHTSELLIRIAGGHVLVIDESDGTRLEIQNVEGVATRKGEVFRIADLRGSANGGMVQLAAQFDRSGTDPEYEGEFRAKDVGMSEGMSALEHLVPILAGTPKKLTGKLTMNLYVRTRGETREALEESMVAQGEVRLESVELSGSRFIAALSSLVDKPIVSHVGTVTSTLAIKGRRVRSDKLTIDCGQSPPAELAGWTDFDGRVDYHPRTEGLSERLKSKSPELLARLKIDVKDIAGVRLEGTLDRLTLTVNGAPVDDKTQLREIGHRIRERVLH